MANLGIYFVTEDDPLYVVRFFETFFREYPRDEITVAGVTVMEPFNESRLETARRIFSLYGFGGFVRLLTRVIERKVRRHSVASLVRREGIPIVATRSVNAPAFVEHVRGRRPDVIISVAAPEIFKRDLLGSARLACINVHSGRLPTYRGMMPTFWQMRFGERCVTVTVHEMAPELDAGAVLGTDECVIASHDSLDRVMTQTKELGARLVIRVLRDLAVGDTKSVPLDMAKASYFTFPQRADVAEFRRRGHRLL